MALSSPGVVQILTAADLTGPNNFYGMAQFPEPIMVGLQQQVMYAGQSIALVLAQTQAQADTAALLVTSTYANQQTPIQTIADARANPERGLFNYPIPPIVSGNLQPALQSSQFVIQGQVDCGSQYHFHMETQTAIAVPQDDGGLQVYSATQSPDFTVRCISAATGLSGSMIRVEMRRMGGAYGGKISRCLLASVACSVAALITGQPVRIQVRTALVFVLIITDCRRI